MHASFLGCLIVIQTMADTVELARRAMRSQQRLQHLSLNVARFVNMRFDPVLAADVAGSYVISIDGTGIVWGARALGQPVKSRVTGVDLLTETLALSAREGSKPYFLGATGSVLQQAARRVLDKVLRSRPPAFWPKPLYAKAQAWHRERTTGRSPEQAG